jgi:hypothetical protein
MPLAVTQPLLWAAGSDQVAGSCLVSFDVQSRQKRSIAATKLFALMTASVIRAVECVSRVHQTGDWPVRAVTTVASPRRRRNTQSRKIIGGLVSIVASGGLPGRRSESRRGAVNR